MAAEDAMTSRPRAWLPALGALAILAGGAGLLAAQQPPPASDARSGADADASVIASQTAGRRRLPAALALLEPIKVPGQLTESAVRAAIGKEYFPNQLTVIPRDGDRR